MLPPELLDRICAVFDDHRLVANAGLILPDPGRWPPPPALPPATTRTGNDPHRKRALTDHISLPQ